MTTPSDAARLKAEEVVSQYWSKSDDSGLRRHTVDAIAIALTIPAGHVRTPDGVDRKVLGTLPVTADGVIAGSGAALYWNHGDGSPCNDGTMKVYVQDNTSCPSAHFYLGAWYSTRESAQAAQRSKSE
jgi:hypothetical protein